MEDIASSLSVAAAKLKPTHVYQDSGCGDGQLGGEGGVVDGEGLVGDAVPGVAGAGAVGGGDAERLELHGVGEQGADLLGEEGGAAGLDQEAGGAVEDGVDLGAGGGRDDGGAAGHGLDGGDGGRVVLVEVDHQVGRAQQRREAVAADLAGEQDPAAQVEGVAEPGEPPVGQVALELGAGRAAGHDQLGAGDLGERAQQGVEGVPLGGEVGDGDQAVPAAALAGRAVGGELAGVDPGGDDPDGAAGDAEPGQVGLLVGGAGHDGADGGAARG